LESRLKSLISLANIITNSKIILVLFYYSKEKGGIFMRTLNESIQSQYFDISDFLGDTFECECGRQHTAAIRQISTSETAVNLLVPYLKENSFSKAFLICDPTTYKIAGQPVCNLLTEANQAFSSYIIASDEPVPDERTIGEILINYDRSCDLIIGIGSGTINDLSRFVSYKLGIPYIIVATAPSMDGFASNVAPLIVNNLKTTYEAQTPLAIFADTGLLKTAPINMIAAGIGDILGKYSCLCDWELAHIITGEYWCPSVAALVNKSLDSVVAGIDGAAAKTDESMQAIMNALVLSGIAMSFVGNSRPASGSEHHLSHYWEMVYLLEGRKAILHGTKVGIGTVAVLKAYELLVSKNIDFDKAKAKAMEFNFDKWEADMKNAYKMASDSVISLEKKVAKNSPANVTERINKLESNWTRVKQIIGRLPSADTVRSYLKSLGAPDSPISIGIDKDLFITSFIVAKELRNRYGLLQILFDLGLTKEIAEEVWAYFC